jgi:hypothetical protein
MAGITSVKVMGGHKACTAGSAQSHQSCQCIKGDTQRVWQTHTQQKKGLGEVAGLKKGELQHCNKKCAHQHWHKQRKKNLKRTANMQRKRKRARDHHQSTGAYRSYRKTQADNPGASRRVLVAPIQDRVVQHDRVHDHRVAEGVTRNPPSHTRGAQQ